MNTKDIWQTLADAKCKDKEHRARRDQLIKTIHQHLGALAYAQMQIAAKKREIHRAAARLDLMKIAYHDFEAADPYPYGTRHTQEARYYLRLVVREHRAALKRLAQEQTALKANRKNAGVHLAEIQREAAAFLKDVLAK